jgi:hypothetical protein
VLFRAAAVYKLTSQDLASASSPTRYRASPADDGRTVIISFEMPNSLQHHYALNAKDAANLAKRIGAAVNRGTRSKRTPHH